MAGLGTHSAIERADLVTPRLKVRALNFYPDIRLLRSRWRGLETESRFGLHGHEWGNPGYRQDQTSRTTAPALDPTGDMVPTYTQHKKLLQWIGSNEPDKPWLLKSPVHMKHLKSFLRVYPDARVIWTHRDPASIMSSYASMIEVLRGLSVRPETIDRNEILHEQMEIWAAGAERAMAVREQYPEAQFYDLHFADFVADPIAQVQKAYQQFGIDWTPECEAALRQWSEGNPQHKHGKHSHSGEQLALSKEQIQERFASYINRFNVERT